MKVFAATVFVSAFVIAGVASQQTGFDGKWAVDVGGTGVQLHLSTQGAKLTGTLNDGGASGPLTITEGNITGTTATFKTARPGESGPAATWMIELTDDNTIALNNTPGLPVDPAAIGRSSGEGRGARAGAAARGGRGPAAGGGRGGRGGGGGAGRGTGTGPGAGAGAGRGSAGQGEGRGRGDDPGVGRGERGMGRGERGGREGREGDPGARAGLGGDAAGLGGAPTILHRMK